MLAEAGYAIFSISYDAVAVLGDFAARYGITYPLLSDEGSEFITALGMRNSRIEEQAAQYGVRPREEFQGTTHPGTFVLDEDGVVVERRFEQSYRLRMTGASLVNRLLGATGAGDAPVRAEAQADGAVVVAWLTDAEYRPWMQQDLHVVVQLDDGIHIYGEPIPDGYVPLQIEVEPVDDLWVGEPLLPPARPFRVRGIDEDFRVFEESVEVMIPFTVLVNRGPMTLRVVVRFQACTDQVCFPPVVRTVELPMIGADHDLSVPPIRDDSLPDL